jgi:hypothetical protein
VLCDGLAALFKAIVKRAVMREMRFAHFCYNKKKAILLSFFIAVDEGLEVTPRLYSFLIGR